MRYSVFGVPFLIMFVSAIAFVATTGCRLYDRPEFVEIDTSETGFLIPLEGGTEHQQVFESERYLNQRKVATRRVQIPHRWIRTGRMYWTGHWMETARLVKVDRSPVTREWTADTARGVQARDLAFRIESKDSVGLLVGFNCTAYVRERDTARFLYMYRCDSLADLLDTEVRARIQSIAADYASRNGIEQLCSHKRELIDEVRTGVIPFFKQRGITITTIGMIGGITYQNSKIRDAMADTFVAQQLQVIAQARLQAAQQESERIELAARALTDLARTDY